MKHSKKTVKSVLLTLTAATMALTAAGCGENSGNSSDGDTLKIGVLQYADHPSLDNCRIGFEEALKASDLKYELVSQSAQGDDATNTQIAQNFAAQKYDLVCGVATPSAQAAYNACYGAKIPVVFNAVSDPIAANLAKSKTETVDGITGISDELPVSAQLELIREMLPDAKKVGILYTTSEANSVSTIETYKKEAPNFGFEIVEKGITNAAEIPQAVDLLVAEVDCVSNMTDNTVVNNLPVLIEKATAKNVPVFGSEEEQVGNGCIASAGIDYIELGKKSGDIAVRVLKGEDINTISYETMTESKVTINTDVASKIGVTIPDSITEKAEVKNSPTEAK